MSVLSRFVRGPVPVHHPVLTTSDVSVTQDYERILEETARTGRVEIVLGARAMAQALLVILKRTA